MQPEKCPCCGYPTLEELGALKYVYCAIGRMMDKMILTQMRFGVDQTGITP